MYRNPCRKIGKLSGFGWPHSHRKAKGNGADDGIARAYGVEAAGELKARYFVESCGVKRCNSACPAGDKNGFLRSSMQSFSVFEDIGTGENCTRLYFYAIEVGGVYVV